MGKRDRGITSIARFLDFLEKPIPVQVCIADAIEDTQPEVKIGSVRPAPSESQSSSHPSKRRKIGLLGPDWEKYDATHLVTRYSDESQVPEHLQKYFAQRERYFSMYSEGCLLDEEGWYSVTPEKMADQIAERCRCDTILDAFCGVGGNAIAFAKTCNRVIALDISPVRLALARHNAVIYGVADRIEFILTSYLDFARSFLARPHASRQIDVIFLSPPWGGPSYLLGTSANLPIIEAEAELDPHPEYSLDSILPIPGSDLFHLSRRITPNIAYLLPRNTNLSEISALVPRRRIDSAEPNEGSGAANPSLPADEMIEVEEEFMGKKLKALTCYFGGLVVGQEVLF